MVMSLTRTSTPALSITRDVCRKAVSRQRQKNGKDQTECSFHRLLPQFLIVAVLPEPIKFKRFVERHANPRRIVFILPGPQHSSNVGTFLGIWIRTFLTFLCGIRTIPETVKLTLDAVRTRRSYSDSDLYVKPRLRALHLRFRLG